MKKQPPEQIAQDIFLLGGQFEDYDTEQLISVLVEAAECYFNTNTESFLSDQEYDAIYTYVKVCAPHHSYFTGVGAEVRGGKVDLPVPLGSLNQLYENEIEDWIADNSLTDKCVVITDKLDGISALVVYDTDGAFQIGFSRGSGLQGADLSRHLRKIPSVPKHVSKSMMVRGELIVKKENWKKISSLVKTSAGKPYKNLRNMIAGLMNSKEIENEEVYTLIDFVAYEIL